jgi:hypothetical protein
LDHLAKLVERLHRLLDLGQFQANGVSLVHHLEDGKADGALEEQVIDHHHLGRLKYECRGVGRLCLWRCGVSTLQNLFNGHQFENAG